MFSFLTHTLNYLIDLIVLWRLHHQMQETHNNCFGSKKYSTTLLQAKTGKHECRIITAKYCKLLLHFGTHAYLFSPDEGSSYFFQCETIVASFIHLMVLFCKVIFNHSVLRGFYCWVENYLYFFFFKREQPVEIIPKSNCCKFHAMYGVILQSDIQPYVKTPVCDVPFSYVLVFLVF